MEKTDEYYSKIVYKKNAFSDLCIDLKVYYRGKNILLVSSKSVSCRYITEIVNAMSMSGCSFSQFIAKHHFDKSELNHISNKIIQGEFDLIISLGAGKVTDVVKYFANMVNVPYFVCPTAPSNISYFSRICINPYDATKSFYADEPERIYISEIVIRKSPKMLVKQGVCFILSFYEYLLSCLIDNMLFDKNLDTSLVCKVIEKLEKNLDNIVTGDDDAKLELMDFMIEMGYCLLDVDLFSLSLYNLYFILQKMCQENEKIIGGGEILLVSAKMLIESYQKLFSLNKIRQLDVPDYVRVADKIKKFNIFVRDLNNQSFFNEICKNTQLIDRINNLKEEFSFQCLKKKEELKIGIKKISSYNKFCTTDKLSIDRCLDALSILPFVSKNKYIVSLMGGVGLLNNL